jgi:hypothetical protein
VTLCPTNGRSEEQALREALQVVEHNDALVRRTVLNLSRNCPPHLICEAARGKLLELRPHLEEALEALANIERRRGLTDQERALKRAFRVLLETGELLAATA